MIGVLIRELRVYREVKEYCLPTFVVDLHPYVPNVLLSAVKDGHLMIWDITKGEVIKDFYQKNEDDIFYGAKWNLSGSTIAAVTGSGHLLIYGICNNFTVC